MVLALENDSTKSCRTGTIMLSAYSALYVLYDTYTYVGILELGIQLPYKE